MPVNIGPRIGIEGEDEYRKQITNLVQSTKTLDAQMKALEATSDKEATAQEKAAKKAELLSQKQKEQEKRIEALNKMVEESAKQTGENSTQTLKWKEALANAETELNKTNTELENAQAAADGYSTEAEDATGKTSEFVTELSKMEAQKTIADILGQIGDKFAELGEKALDAAKELDQGYDTIIKKTGASGEALADMQNIADDIYGSMPSEMEDVGTAVGEVNTRFGLTGDQLKDVSKTFLEFSKITDTDVNTAVGSTAKILKAFGGDVEDADKLLGYFAKQSQQTGIDTGTLMSSLEQNGATMREMGFDVQESAKLLASFEANGVDASAAMTGFKKAIANGAKEGKDANTVIAEMVDSIQNASTDTEALAAATELFGTKGAVVMADGIRDGRINLDDLSDSLDNYGDVVSSTFEETLDPWDKSAVAINNVKVAGKELAGEALAAIEPLLEKVVDLVQGAVKWFKNLPDPVKKVIGVIGLLGVGAGKVAPKVGSLFSTIQQFKSAKAILELAKMQDAMGDMGAGAGKAGGLFKTEFLGPFALVAGASVAFVGAMAAINDAINDHIEAEYGLTAEEQAVIDKINEASQAYDDMAAAREEAVGNVQAEYDHIEALAKEYDTLVDANGKVKKGYEDRAAYILNEMSSATGKSIEEIQKEVDANGSLVAAIQDVIDKKRAEATLSAYESSYAEAVQNQKTALEDLIAAQDVAKQRQQEYDAVYQQGNTYRQQRADLEAKIAAARDPASLQSYQTQLMALDGEYQIYTKQLEASKSALDESNAAVETASTLYEGYNTTIANYEGLSAAIISGDQAKINDALTLMVNGFKSASDATEEELQKQVDAAKQSLADIEKAYKEGKVDKATYQMARDAVKAAEKELKKLKGVGEDTTQGLANGIEAKRAVVERKAKQIGLLSVQSVAAGAETNSPSRATLRTGQDVDAGLVNGMEGGKALVSSKGREVGTAATTGITTTATTGVKEYGSGLANLVASGLNDSKQGVTDAALAIANSANTNIKPSTTGVQSAGESLGSALATGLSNKKSDVETAAGGLATAIEKAKVPQSTAEGWGQAVGQGLINGMNSKLEDVGKAAESLGNKVKTKTKKPLNINSPSKVMEEIGKFAAEGLAIGLDQPRIITKAVEQMVSPVIQVPTAAAANSLTYGDINVTVNGANVQNDAALAKMVSNEIFRRVQAQKAVWS